MRAFLALISLFSLSVGNEFTRWLDKLKNNQLLPEYRWTGGDPISNEGTVNFQIHASPETFFVKAHLQYSPNYVTCTFIPDVEKFKKEVLAEQLLSWTKSKKPNAQCIS